MDEKPDKFNDLDADLSSQFNEKFGLEEESSTPSSNTHAPISHHADQEHDVSFLDSNVQHAKTMTRSESSGTAQIAEIDTSIDHVAKEEEEQAVKQASNDPEFQQIITQFDPTVEENKSPDVNSTLPEIERLDSNMLQAPERKSSDSSRSSQETAKPAEPQEIPFDFNRFLEQMRRRGAMPITRYFKSFLREFDRRPWSVNEQIKIVQDFLDFIYIKMRDCEVWRDCTDQEFENAKEGMEKLVMNRLYQYTFSPNTTDDKERDEILHQKISIFRWVTEEHLDIPITSHNESFLSFAQSELLKINNYKAPRDKLICILNSCKVIFGLIKHVEGDAGADKFLPILIYVVLKANPPNLISNVQYISRFRNPEYLQSESGYYLTNLMGAVAFIEGMEAKSLSISEEEFEEKIGKTMHQLESERPKLPLLEEKGKVNYDNVVPPSRSPRLEPKQPLIDPAKAAKLLERGSNFAQRTIQKPLNFVGKILQELNDAGSSGPVFGNPQLNGSRSEISAANGSRSDSLMGPSQSSSSTPLPDRGANSSQERMTPELSEKQALQREQMRQQQQLLQQQRDRQVEFEQAQLQQQQFLEQLRYQQQQQQQNQTSSQQPPQHLLGGFQWPQIPDTWGITSQHQLQPQPQSMSSDSLYEHQTSLTRRSSTRSINTAEYVPPQPPSPPPRPRITREQYENHLASLNAMFPNIDPDVRDMILNANDGRLEPSIDTLLEIAETLDPVPDPLGTLPPLATAEDELIRL